MNSAKNEFFKPTVMAMSALMISSGIRGTAGLFVNPLIQSTALNLAAVSMAMAIGQFAFGLFQPLGGFLTTRFKTFSVMLSGALCLAAGHLGVKFATSLPLLILCFGVLAPAGAAATSFPILMGVIAKAVPQEKRSFSSGLVNAGGSAGQFVLAPLIQIFLNSYGVYGACIFLAAASAVSIVPSWLLCKNNPDVRAIAPLLARDKADDAQRSIKEEIIRAFKNRNYVFLHLGFFACGFHIAFMATHLPGEIKYFGLGAGTAAMFFSILGACNIAGSFFAGVLGGYAKQKNVLAGIYALRVALICAYLALPKTLPVFIVFAALAGLTWLATVPPVSGITAQMVRPQNLSTLFGLIFVTHQIGSFFGAWLGGVVMTKTGSFFPMWIIDVALSLFAAVISARIV